MKCSKCGTEIRTGDEVCKGCGSVVNWGFRRSGEKQQIKSESMDWKKIPLGDKSENPGVVHEESGYDFNDEMTRAPGLDDSIPPVADYDHVDNLTSDSEMPGSEENKKEKKRKWPVILGICAGVLVLLAAIGYLNMETYSEEDAQTLVKATIDSITTGEYDADFEFYDMTREEAMNDHKDIVKSSVDQSQKQNRFTDALRDRTEEMWNEAWSKTNYTVGKATEQDDGSYSVRVTVKPLDLYAGMDGMYYKRLEEKLEAENPEIYEEDADDSLYFDATWNVELDQIIDTNLKNPVYRMEEYCTVKVSKNDDGYYEANPDDITAIVDKLVYYDSRWNGVYESES